MYIKRTMETTIIKASHSFPVLMVTGPRQIGKTTLLQRCSEPSRRYITLDDLNERSLAKSDPELFFKSDENEKQGA